MKRDAYKGISGTWGEVLNHEIAGRKYKNIGGDLYQHEFAPEDMMTQQAFSRWAAIRRDNWNDGFDAGLEYALKHTQEEIEEQLNLG